MSETVDHRRVTELRSLLSTIEDAGWEYARIEIDGVVLEVSSDPDFARAGRSAAGGTPPTPAAATSAAAPAVTPPQAPAPAPAANASSQLAWEGDAETVTSPTIGLFWRSPKPGAPPFVEVGDRVKAGETVCIIEVMKLMTHVSAPVDGVVRAVRIDNGSMVEHGTALIDIEPAAAEGAA